MVERLHYIDRYRDPAGSITLDVLAFHEISSADRIEGESFLWDLAQEYGNLGQAGLFSQLDGELTCDSMPVDECLYSLYLYARYHRGGSSLHRLLRRVAERLDDKTLRPHQYASNYATHRFLQSYANWLSGITEVAEVLAVASEVVGVRRGLVPIVVDLADTMEDVWHTPAGIRLAAIIVGALEALGNLMEGEVVILDRMRNVGGAQAGP